MAEELSSIAGIISSILTLIIALETKAVYKFFKENKAFSSENMVEFDNKNFFKKKIFKRLLGSGEIVEEDRKYYLNLELHNKLKKKRIKRMKIILPIVITVSIIFLFVFV